MCDNCAIFVVHKPGLYTLAKGLDDIHSNDCKGILWSKWPPPNPEDECGFEYIHPEGGPGCELTKFQPKSVDETAVAAKLTLFLQPHQASRTAVEVNAGEALRENQFASFKQKPAMLKKRCLDGQNYRGNRLPLLLWTTNAGRRSADALRRRRTDKGAKGFQGGKGDKGGKGGKGFQGGKGGKGTKGFQGGQGDKGGKGNKGLPRWRQQASAFEACSVPPALPSIPPAQYTAAGTPYLNHPQFHGMQMAVPSPITGAHQALAQSSSSSGGADAWQSHCDGGASFGSCWDNGHGTRGGWSNHLDGSFCWASATW